ncbi:prohead protease/major capsid protein fusion protein [Mesorhizobium sp. B4-1-1]|uniref:prohead protease/major capsid protein fusion protein n=1 Tax=Mesorhizobium sp. B4-1-1 TaxID=2589890 RepID=UPI00112A511E|nr:prohead protease/major capsid protein fusion protein [Mesorhizobium sp. B4-1-1]TPI16579.1 peptidase U35 [Mesorhizobium sp. B4-1-1]
MTIHHRDFRPRSIDEAARTVELVASTGAAVPRMDMAGSFAEVLTVSAAAVDLSRIATMPLLDSHRQDGLERQLGVVRSARIVAGELIVTVEFSQRAEAIWQDVKAGIIANASVAYGVIDFVDSIDAAGRRTRTITRWQPREISLVPVGADAGATTRGNEMPDPVIVPAPAPAPAPAPVVVPPAPVVTRAAVNQEIRALAATFNLGAEFADGLIDSEATIVEARAAAAERVQQQQTRIAPRAFIVNSNDASPEQIAERMGEALYLRANPRHQLSEQARPFVGLTTLDMAREMMRLRGVATSGLSPAETITRALQTTSDFPLIFADTANRSLRTAYQAAPATLKRVARQTTARDFRAKTMVQLGEAPTLEKVNEHGEFKYGTMAEAGESYKIDSFGKIVGLSRKAIVNDDLGAFTDLASKMGAAAADFEAQFLVDLLESGAGLGPLMADTKRLFHVDHGNLAATPVAFTEDNPPQFYGLDAARLAMRKQTGLSGRRINVAPKFLLVPPEAETVAEKALATIQAASVADVNPFGGKLELLVEARMSDSKRWYVVADPATAEGLEFAYLQGAEGPQTATRAGFEVDGVEVKVSLDFGAAFLDYRSWYMNPGD